MDELTFEYWNKLAEQTITVSSLLGGFSIAVIANLLISNVSTKLNDYLVATSTLAACFFLITVFAMTTILLKTTNGYPHQVDGSSLNLPRLVGVISFYLGIISLLTLISLSGWSKSKRLGIFTTVIGVITLIITFMMTMI